MIKEKAWAKLNLNLHIIPKESVNGYYPVRFINCQLTLHDDLFFISEKEKITVVCDHPKLIDAQKNLVYKAACLIKNMVKDKQLGVKIILKKNIPVRVGLGGGSSDAAATIRGLMKIWKVRLTTKQLFYLAENLGRDVFYCLEGGLCEIRGDGAQVIPLILKTPALRLVIVIPEEEKPSTSWMYKNLDFGKIGQNLNQLTRLKKGLRDNKKSEIFDSLHNDFEYSVEKKNPFFSKIKVDFQNFGAENSLLCGSGLAVAGFFATQKKAKKAYDRLVFKYKNIILTKTK